MEGGREDGGRRWRGAGCGDDDEESSHGSSGGGVELILRLRTGAADDDDGGGAASAPPPPPRAATAVAEAARRRNMTIFYNGRVCAVDVTEVQARAIISMASEETLLAADHRRPQRHHQVMRDGDGDSSSSAAVARRCARDRGHVRPPAAVALAPSLVAAGVIGSSRQGGFAGGAVAAPAVVEVDPAAPTGLSMKRSLQLFLQKRKARTAAAVAPPYAGAGHRQAQAVRR